MEDAEEIENFYEKAIEGADKEFLEKTKISKDKKQTEKEYKEKIKSIRDQYGKKYQKYIKFQKNKKEKKPKPKKEKHKLFKVKGLNLQETKREKLKKRYSLFKFRLHIKRKNFMRKITPRFLIILGLQSKYSIKRAISATRDAIDSLIKSIKEKSISAGKKTKETSKKVYGKIVKFFSSISKKIRNKIKPKKSEEDKKSEDQLLAEKILAKK